MHGMTSEKVMHRKRRHSDYRGFKSQRSLSQAFKIGFIRQDGEVRISTKFRPAVKHAGLTAHQQGANLAVLES